MIPLSSWLSCQWRHADKAAGYSSVLSAAQRLDDEVWERHRFKLMYLDDPCRFRDLSEKEVERARTPSPEEAPDYPQLGTHADVTCRAISKDTFYSLIGCVTDRPLRCITMNTAAVYRASDECSHVIDLFNARLLWSDHPERDCAGLETECGMAVYPLPAVHLGTAWTTPLRRKQGIMERVSRLHRLVCYLRFGELTQFATIVPNRNHDKLFHGREIGTVIETKDGLRKESRVLIYTPEDIRADAESIISHQWSALVQTPTRATWLTRRPEAQGANG